MGRKKYIQKQIDNPDEIWTALDDGTKNFILKYLNDPIIPEATTDELVAFMKSGIGFKIVSLIIQYGKMCAKNERKNLIGQSQEQINKIRAILEV